MAVAFVNQRTSSLSHRSSESSSPAGSPRFSRPFGSACSSLCCRTCACRCVRNLKTCVDYLFAPRVAQGTGQYMSLSQLDVGIAIWIWYFVSFNQFLGGVIGATIASQVSLRRMEHTTCCPHPSSLYLRSHPSYPPARPRSLSSSGPTSPRRPTSSSTCSASAAW